MPQLDVASIELTEEQRTVLTQTVRRQVDAALLAHRRKEDLLRTYRDAYKAKPEHEKKSYPWPGASNVVIPIVAITVDNVVARLMRAFMGMPTPVEAQIRAPQYENLEKDFRDWAEMFLTKSGARDRLRTGCHDMAVDGTTYFKPSWAEKKRLVHSYSPNGGQITQVEVTDYVGVIWDEIPSDDMIYPSGFDEWKKLPWMGHRLRFTWDELLEKQDDGSYHGIDDKLKASAERAASSRGDSSPSDVTDIYTFIEIWGRFQVPLQNGGPNDLQYVECILTYSTNDHQLHREIYNPFFGQARHFVRIPFLHQPHEIEGQGCAEQVLPFQLEASSSHNQSIDAATAAIAGIVVRKPSAEPLSGKEIYPGAEIVTDNPKEDFLVMHLAMGNSHLPNVEQQAAFWAEKRSGVSAYSMGVESPVAGSRATATGTTALINEGNLRFWVSIDDMRQAVEDLFYLTLQLEQQYRPEGTPISEGRVLIVPQGDLREIFGLRLIISSEKVNRDIEIQNFQILINVLNDYYGRLMQAAALVMNPGFPPGQKVVTLQVMDATCKLIKRLVERFDVENIDELVPNLEQAIQMIGGQLGPNNVAGNPGGGPQALSGGAPGGPAGPVGGPPNGQVVGRPAAFTR